MRILIVKTSSLGDIVHTFPAITEACQHINSLQIEWLVEKGFSEVPAWHPGVKKVLTCNLRTWKRRPLSALRRDGLSQLRQQFVEPYDAIIDAQGLLKSALLSCWAKGPRHGYDKKSIREPLASYFYQERYNIARNQHAIERIRALFGAVLGYQPSKNLSYGLHSGTLPQVMLPKKSIICVHGTTWASKHWPEQKWKQLIKKATDEGYRLYFPQSNAEEYARAQRLCQHTPYATVLPQMSLTEMAAYLKAASAVIATDSGLAHITAAVGTPAVTLYGPTNPGLTGTLGDFQSHFVAEYPCSPCYQRHCSKLKGSQMPPCWEALSIEALWDKLCWQMEQKQKCTQQTALLKE